MGEYQKIPDIVHHTSAQVSFLGHDPAYYHRVFRFEELSHLESFLSERAGRPVALHRLRAEGPAMSDAVIEADLRDKIAVRYEADRKFLQRMSATVTMIAAAIVSFADRFDGMLV